MSRFNVRFVGLIFWISTFSCSWGQVKLFSIEGSFQGKNLFVNNPPQSDGFGYCVSKVTVNGDILPASIQSSTFEIDFSVFRIKNGDPVFVVLEHSEGCEPKFINPEVLLPKSTFICTDIQAETSGKITWKTKEEQGVLDFIIEQYRWEKWVEVGQVKGKGTSGENSYYFELTPHSGVNKIRISQVDNSGKKRSTKEITFTSSVKKVNKYPAKVRDYLYFTSGNQSIKTKYEVYDAFGNLLKLGFSEKVDCRNLVNGIYFVNFDNTSEKFIKIEK